MTVMSQTTTLSECDHVTVSYGEGHAKVTALDDVSLKVREGESIALWGRSGSGKTTVLHALGGLVAPTDGVVRWHGEPLSTLDAAARGRARARGIAYVFQGSNLLPTLSAWENIAFAARVAREREGSRPLDPDRLLEVVGLSTKGDSLPAELSGGEQQRVAIARALVQRPEMLLCDEPTGHLDSATGVRILDMIEALWKELGFALVIATHDATVAARAGQVVEMAAGKLVGEVQ
jgi:putative ABC transport system ATP-binding protein